MLDKCQQFKAAFLQGCVSDGLTIEETHAAVKQACELLEGEQEKKAAGVWDAIKGNVPGLATLSGAVEGVGRGIGRGVGERIIPYTMGAAIGAPIAAGAATGYGLAQLRGINDEEPDEIKTREKIEALRRAAARATLQKQLKTRSNARRPSRPLL